MDMNLEQGSYEVPQQRLFAVRGAAQAARAGRSARRSRGIIR